MDYLHSRYKFIDVLMLLGILFIGSDKWGITLGGINIRIIQIYYLFVVLYMMYKGVYYISGAKPIFVFLGLMVLSSLFSINKTSSILFLIWMLYNFFVIVNMLYSYIRYRGIEKLVDIFRFTLLIIFVLCLISAVLTNVFHYDLPFFTYQHHMGIGRTALWFYEPSYLATFLSIYLGFSTYQYLVGKKKNYIYDLVFSVAAIALTTATTGFIAIALTIGISFVYGVFKIKGGVRKLKFVGLSALAFLLVFGIVYIAFPNVYSTFIARLFRDGISSSSGNRIEEYNTAFTMFKQNFLFGVGPNCYGAFLGDPNIQPTNVTLELLSTTGIFTTLAFYGILIYPIKHIFKLNNKSLLAFLSGTVLFMVILQANQNYMRLYLWMCIGILYSYSYLTKEQEYNNILFHSESNA